MGCYLPSSRLGESTWFSPPDNEAELNFSGRPLKKPSVEVATLRLAAVVGAVDVFGLLVLCRLRPEGGSDRVEVDEHGGPDGLECRLALPVVAALAPAVAVDDEPE